MNLRDGLSKTSAFPPRSPASAPLMLLQLLWHVPGAVELPPEGNDPSTIQHHGQPRHDASSCSLFGTVGSDNGQAGESVGACVGMVTSRSRTALSRMHPVGCCGQRTKPSSGWRHATRVRDVFPDNAHQAGHHSVRPHSLTQSCQHSDGQIPQC